MDNKLEINNVVFNLDWQPINNGYSTRLENCEELYNTFVYGESSTREDVLRRAYAACKGASPEDYKPNFYFNSKGVLCGSITCMRRFKVNRETFEILVPHLGVNLRTLQAVALQQNMPEQRRWRIVWEENGAVIGEIRVK